VIEQSLGKNYSRFVNVLIFIFPILINSVKVGGDIVLFILAVMGIFIAISQKLSPFNIKGIKVFSYLTAGYFIALCLVVLFSVKGTEQAHLLSRDLYFLFAPFIALAFYKAEINASYLLSGVKVGLIVLGLISFGQLESGNPRPSGVMNADVFANLAVSMFFVVLVFYQQESFKYKIFTLVSLLSGLFVIAASGTRGAWLSFLLLLGGYLYFLYKQKAMSSARSKIIAVLIITSVLSVVSLNQSVKDRTQLAYTETSNWLSGDETPNSVSLRLEMYKTAIDNIKDVPLFGYGLRTSNIVLHNLSTAKFQRYIVSFNHLHNVYLTNYFNGGIFLLVTLLLLLFAPLILFIKANSQSHDDPVFISGALLTLGYASYGMVNILFGDVFMNAFYVFFLAIFFVLTARSKKIS
jgi:O-antigen ligase